MPNHTTATVELSVRSRRIALAVVVPTGPASARVVLPLAHAAADAAVEAVTETISCRAGCAACCCELVPLAEPEAYALAALVAAMPEPRRSDVRQRFAVAVQRALKGGLLESLRQPGVDQLDRTPASESYFALGIACPFLEDESCSIYADRPLVCREHLVTSPAEECQKPTAGGVKKVELSIPSPFRALAATAVGRQVGDSVPWIPLVLTLAWTAGRPEPSPTRTGPEWVGELAARLTEGRHAG